jgi:N-acetylmuramoyl-L-alanine amidase
MSKMSRQWVVLTLPFLMAGAGSLPAWANEGDHDTHDSSGKSSSTLDPTQAFIRSSAVLHHFGVPDEESTQAFFDDLHGSTSPEAAKAILPYLDRKGSFPELARWNLDPSGTPELDVYQDDRALRVLDYSVRLDKKGTGEYSSGGSDSFYEHLARASGNPPEQALKGLRIAFDPGHMGSEVWDKRTGKFVIDHATGRKLSEGVMNLQIALLLEDDFRRLGAETMITHRHLAPVTDLPYETFDLKPYALRELREDSLDPWFQDLLAIGSESSPALYEAFSTSSHFRKLFDEFERGNYFILDEDLDARVNVINAFHPDITLIIHLDIASPANDPNGISERERDGTKVYVPGGMVLQEMSSRLDRKFLGRHLLDTKAWQASVSLGHQIVGHIHSELDVPFDHNDPDTSVQVEPGVFARDLTVQRGLYAQATSYIEGLFYSDRKEFEALSDTKHPMKIDGEDHPYSDRLLGIVKAIQDGVLAFVQDHQSERP